MSRTIPAHIVGSVVNSIAHQNLRYLRQKAVDEYWDEKAKELLRKRSIETKKSRKPRIKIGSKTEFTKKDLAAAKYELIFELMRLGPIEENWSTNTNLPHPHPVGSQEKFAERAGIKLGHFDMLEKGEVAFTLDDAVKIARACDIDLATFLTPSKENLETDTYLDLQPQHPTHGPVLMFEWLLWIHGYRPLPGQDPKKFRELNALPKVFVENPVDARRERDIEEREKELKEANDSILNVMDMFAEKVPKRSSSIPLTPYEKSNPPDHSTPPKRTAIIKSTLAFAARIKVLFRTDNGTQGLKILKKRFADSIFVIRGQAVLIVKMLIGLGK